MSDTSAALIDDAWQSGLKNAQSMGRKQCVKNLSEKISREGVPEYMTYAWWRMQAQLAWIGGREVMAYGESEEG